MVHAQEHAAQTHQLMMMTIHTIQISHIHHIIPIIQNIQNITMIRMNLQILIQLMPLNAHQMEMNAQYQENFAMVPLLQALIQLTQIIPQKPMPQSGI